MIPVNRSKKNRNNTCLYLLIGLTAVLVAVLGYNIYDSHHIQPSGTATSTVRLNTGG